ncbi:MAG: class IIb bacteriocin, lactobin A/cerein 7B family [Mangrovibacterium sp.]
MKNSESFKAQEMTQQEMKEVSGGWGWFVAKAVAIAIGIIGNENGWWD